MRLVNAGFKLLSKPASSSSDERERKAFFAGAQHLFASIMNSGLDEDAEPTDADLRRMNNIAEELKRFEESLRRESSN